MRGLIWFREDLRVADHPALYHATQQCSDGLIGLYVIDKHMWKKHDIAACRVAFILRGLKMLGAELNKMNIPLLILYPEKTSSLADQMTALIEKNHISAIFFNQQHEIDEFRRDQAIVADLNKKNILCQTYEDQTLLPLGKVVTQAGDHFKVFTAYKNAWYKTLASMGELKTLSPIKIQTPLPIKSSAVPDCLPEFQSHIDEKLWPAGEQEAKKRLKYFITHHLFSYDQERDFPAKQATSQLSPYLASGMISIKTCFLEAYYANQAQLCTGNRGAITWITELIWREFYKNLLVATPRICMHKPYQTATEKLVWKFDEKKLTAWKNGQTGFPIIDAAMRQLNQTGWMHNRLRMVTAMFFTKNLFFDWRIGEAYFMQHLIDGDLAANNGGWQWCASTGTDAAPYFRIFNPITQSQRFDPEGEFIRQYCKELSSLPSRYIHDPRNRRELNYPFPIIDLASSRQHAITAFKALK